MRKVITITESQYSRLINGNLNIVESLTTPLKNLMGCQILEDRQHIIYEGKTYNTISGDEIRLTEQALGLGKTFGTIGKASSDDDDSWSLSDILHTGVDIISTGIDFVAPGSSVIIDIVHGLTYLVEAQFNPAEKDNLYVMGAITFAFALMPGALQLMAPVLKRFVKSGGKMLLKDAPMLASAWKTLSSKISTIVAKLPKSVDEALNSSLGKALLGKHSDKIKTAISNFSSGVKRVLNKLASGADQMTKTIKKKANEIIPLKKQRKLAADKLRKGTKKWSNRLTSKMDISQGNVRSLDGNAVPIHTQPGQSIIRNDKKLQKHFTMDTTKGKHGTWVAKNSDEGKKLLQKVDGGYVEPGRKIGFGSDIGSTKEVSKVFGSELRSLTAAKKLYQNSLKSLSKHPKMAAFFKPFLSGLFPPTAVYKMGKYMLKFVKGAEGTSRGIIAAQVVGFWLYSTTVANVIGHYLCGLGLKDRVTDDEFIKAVEDEDFELLGVSDPLEFSLLNTVVNLLIALPKSYVKTIFQFNDCDTPFSSIYSPVKEIYDSAPGYFKGTPVEKLLVSLKNLPEAISNKVGTEKETGDSMYKKWDGGNKGE